MKRVLIAYFSLSGKTEMMAQHVAEGVRFSGHEAVVRKIIPLDAVFAKDSRMPYY